MLQTIGKTMGGGVRGDCFNLVYQVLFLVFSLKNSVFKTQEIKKLKEFFYLFRFPKAVPIKGCKIRNMKKIILPIISFYFIKYFNFLEYERIHF